MRIPACIGAGLKDVRATFPDKRKTGGVYSLADLGMSGFSLVLMQSDSFLVYRRALEDGLKRSNCQTLCWIRSIPRFCSRPSTRSSPRLALVRGCGHSSASGGAR